MGKFFCLCSASYLLRDSVSRKVLFNNFKFRNIFSLIKSCLIFNVAYHRSKMKRTLQGNRVQLFRLPPSRALLLSE